MNIHRTAVVMSLLILTWQQAFAQATSVELSGQTSAVSGNTYTYTTVFKNSSGQVVQSPQLLFESTSWNITGNYVLISYTDYSYEVQWTEPGTHTISYQTQTATTNFSDDMVVTVTSSPPVTTAATGMTTSSFTANWTAPYGATSYRLDVATDASFTTFVSGYNNLTVSTTSQAVSGLTAGTTYYYRVRAVTSYGTTANSNTTSALTIAAAPVATAASSITSTSFTANWNAVTGITDYFLEVSTSTSFTTLAKSAYVFTTSQTMSSLSAGTTYYYRVTARNASGSSASSNTIQTVTLPAAPVAATAGSITASSFTASWSSVTATGYRLDVSINSSFSTFVSGYNNLSVTTTSKSVTGLTAGTTYYYRVRAVNASGNSANSNVISVLTLPTAPNATAPGSLTTVSFTAQCDPVTGASQYLFDVATTSSFTSILSSYTASSNSQSVTGLSAGTSYFYRVRAKNTSGTSSYSNVVQTATIPLAPVTAGAVVSSATSFTASWSSVTAAGYRLDVSTDINFSTFVTGYNNLTVAGTSANVSGLVSKANYYYRVRAVNALGNPSANSNIATVTEFNQNYVHTVIVTVPGKTTFSAVESATINESLAKYDFFDGLGRPMQSVSVKGSPSKQDVVQPIVYDAFGREPRKYLPYADASTGWYKADALKDPLTTETEEQAIYRSGKQYAFYQQGGEVAHDQFPYSQTLYEASPVNRVLEQGAPGESWQPNPNSTFATPEENDRSVKQAYEYNGASEVLLWTYTYPSAAATNIFGLVNAGTVSAPVYYSANRLYKNRSKGEHNTEVITYTDKEGRTILKRVQAVEGTPSVNNTNYAGTYYIYDDFGTLVCVLPPEAVARLATEYYHASATNASKETFLKRWAFRYKYDDRRRMIQKQVPGAGQTYMVYDARDRLVLTQDSIQRAANPKRWLFMKYDECNRPIATGIKDTAALLTQPAMQAVVNNFYAVVALTDREWSEKYVGGTSGKAHGYTNNSFPRTVTNSGTLDVNKYLTVTYYDKYDFSSTWGSLYNYESDGFQQIVNDVQYQQPVSQNNQVKGLVTGMKVKVLDGDPAGGYTWLKTVNYYDDRYRLVQIKTDNYKGGIDRTSSLYDFTGKVLQMKTTHSTGDITWTGIGSAMVDGNKLVGTATGSVWGNSGAASLQQLSAGQDGWMEVTVGETSTNKMIGFADTNPDLHYNSIDYAFNLSYGSALKIFENGGTTPKITLAGVTPGEVVRIERTGTTIKYYRNGALVYTSLTASNTALMVDAALLENKAALVGVRTSFSTNTSTVARRFDYDHAGRLLKTWHRVNDEPEVLLVANDYNELGQLITKKHYNADPGSTPDIDRHFSQEVDYRYNIRGWLTRMNNSDLSEDNPDAARDYFGMDLLYDEFSSSLNNTRQFNGNISAMKWSTNLGLGLNDSGVGIYEAVQRGYTFKYDALSRLNEAAHQELTTAWGPSTAFREYDIAYDLNGNISKLNRTGKGGTLTDQLSYTYTANQLKRVGDASNNAEGFKNGTNSDDDYSYDGNGNIKTDKNRSITSDITFNYLNLPERVAIGTGEFVKYAYDAMGRKLSQGVYNASSILLKKTDYVGEYVYENDTLQFINHEEGRFLRGRNLITNPSANTLDGYAMGKAVTLSSYSSADDETYVKVVCGQDDSTPGIWLNDLIPVKEGETYVYRVKGYTTTTTTPYLCVGGVTSSSSIDLVWGQKFLPFGESNEAWQTIEFTIPAGVTAMRPAVLWTGQGLTIGQTMYINESQLYKKGDLAESEYQYHLKDHLGNVRVTYTIKAAMDEYTGTIESNYIEQERAMFPNYDDVIRSTQHNHTADPGAVRSVVLNGAATQQVGLAKSLQVMPGDTINLGVYARYFRPSSGGGSVGTLIASAMTSAFGLSSSSVGTEQSAYQSLSTMFNAGWMLGTSDLEDEDAPRAFLNYILFDEDFIPYDMGWDQIDVDGEVTASNPAPAHDYMHLQAAVRKPGYVYIYFSNEDDEIVEVYFDDLNIKHHHSPVIQQQDYYPFGLTFNSHRRENATPNQYQYNGKELQDELNLGWSDYGARMYMSDIGRWGSSDPLAETTPGISPYAYCYDNPVKYIDPTGMMANKDEDRYDDFTGMYIIPTERGGGNLYTGGQNPGRNATSGENGATNPQKDGRKRDITQGDIAVSYRVQEFGTDVYDKDGKLLSHTPEGYYLAAQQAGPGPVIPLGAWVDPSSLRLKKIGEAWYGSAHINEEIGIVKLPFRGYVRVHLNTTVNFLFSANGPYSEKDVAQYFAATAMDRARVSVMRELYANPGLSSSSAASDFKYAFGVHLMFLTFGSEVKKDGYIFQGKVPGSEVRFQWYPSLPPGTGW